MTPCLALNHINSYAEQNALNPALFNKLKNIPTLELSNPRLESSDYKPLGLPIIRPTPAQKAAIFAKINNTQNLINKSYSNLEKCSLMGVNIEIDNQNHTHEYLFTPANACGKPTPYHSKPFWIIQQTGNQAPQVLVADEAYQVRIGQKETGVAKRRIEMVLKGSAPSRYTQKPLEVRCHSHWSFIGGAYNYHTNYAEVYRSDPHTRQLKPLNPCFLLKTRCGNPM